MDSKKKFAFILSAGLLVAGSAATFATKGFKPSNAVCTHNGNHYTAVAATAESAGNKEFWACCSCLQQFLEEPATGTWTDKGAYEGTLPSDHIAYEAPVAGSTFDVTSLAGVWESEDIDGLYYGYYEDTITIELKFKYNKTKEEYDCTASFENEYQTVYQSYDNPADYSVSGDYVSIVYYAETSETGVYAEITMTYCISKDEMTVCSDMAIDLAEADIWLEDTIFTKA